MAYGMLKLLDICQAQQVCVGRPMCFPKYEGKGKRKRRKKRKKKDRKHRASGFQCFLQK